jgi:hypothetical protein
LAKPWRFSDNKYMAHCYLLDLELAKENAGIVEG